MAKIISLSEAASIALHSVILIAKSDKLINVMRIAELTESSKHHVAKVLQRLVKDGFIVSQRGPSGGFVLNRNPNDITLLSIYESIEGRIEIPNCPMEHAICPFDKCFLNNITNRMTIDFRKYLEDNTISNFI